jgi:hypothetical protein
LGAERLGLSGRVDQRSFDALADNLKPGSDESLTPRTKENRRVGYDFNFHCPKSVSVVYEQNRDERISAAFKMSVTETMRELETDMKTRVRVHGENSDRNTGNLVWAEFFRPASKVEPNGRRNGAGSSAPRSQRCVEGNGQPPGEHHRHCTAGEIASELGYSVSYILAVKKAMYPKEATRPRRLDPVEVSEWIYAHPSFRMRDMYECHPKDDPRQERLAFEGV